MNLTKYAVRHPVGITMIVLFFVVLGLYSYWRIGVELFPDINTPYVTVSVNYDGADAESVEQQVVKPVENALSSVSNVQHMTSKAMTGKAQIMLQLDFSANADYAAIDASKKVNAIRNSLPDGIDDPVVVKRDLNATPMMEIAVTSGHPLDEMYSMAENTFQDQIEKADGVSDIDINGGRDREIAVQADRDRLSYYGLTVSELVSQLKAENVLSPAGSVYTDRQQTEIRLKAQYKDIQDIEKIQVTGNSGISIPLTSVASVARQDKRVSRYARVNGQDAVSLSVYKNSDANLVTTAEGVTKVLEQLTKSYPDYQFTVISNSADYVKTALSNTLETLIEGLLTTGLVLFLFLRGWRSTAAVVVAIPTSLISTLFVMYMFGFTFNMMSLMGMTLCIGILVDDSIVVLENIHRHLSLGEPAEKAAVNGRAEIGMAAIAITLCDVVVFMPIAFMTGMTGQFFKQFGLTIVFASLFSLFVSFTLTPMMASRLFKNGLQISDWRVWKRVDIFERHIQKEYELVLAWSFSHARILIGSVLILFMLTVSLVPAGIIGTEYMPKTDEGSFNVEVQLPTDASLERTDQVVRQLENYISAIPEMRYYMSMVGGGSLNTARIRVTLTDRRDRNRTIWDITGDMRNFVKSHITDGDVRVREDQAAASGTPGGGTGPGNGSFRLELRGNNMDDLVTASYHVQQALQKGDFGLTDVSSNYTEGLPELELVPDREKMKVYGMSVGDLTDTFSSAISGVSAGTLANDPLNDGNDTDINVYLAGGQNYRKADVSAIPIQGKNSIVRVSDVAAVKDDIGPVTINRTDKQRSITIGANPSGKPLNDSIQQVKKQLEAMGLPDTVTWRFSGQADQMQSTFEEMISALLMGLVLVYMILSVLYESVKTSFIRMFSLPFGLIGAFLFLFLLNDTINMYSLIGILVMDGMVAKNGTLLLDYTLTLMHQEGMPPKEAVIKAGSVRLRPILMTTFTMIAGMLPTALAVTAGSETRSSMAWVIIGGLVTSTVFTLLVIPIIFLYFEEHSFSLRRKKKKTYLTEDSLRQ